MSASERLRELVEVKTPETAAKALLALPLIADVVEAAEVMVATYQYGQGIMGPPLAALAEHLEGGDVNTVGGGQIGCG